MTCHELASTIQPTPRLRIGIGPLSATEYELDRHGHDDGTTSGPAAPFRLIFRLGDACEIYAYTVGMARPGDADSFHMLSLTDCAAYGVVGINCGAPHHVACEKLRLEPVFLRLDRTAAGQTTTYDVEGFRFMSRPTETASPDLVVRWYLRDTASASAKLT